MQKSQIGNTGLWVTPLCFGTSSLGNMPDTYGYEVTEEQARTTLHAIFEGPVNFLDTSNNYGFGRSEERIGAALNERGGLPENFVLATKLDRDMETGRFDASRVRQSIEESLTRLGLDHVSLVHFHDPEHAPDLQEITCEGGAIDELFKLKEEGITQAVGLAMGRIDIMLPILKDWPFDALVNHNRYTILNRSADGMFQFANEKNIAVFNAAPYAGGVLAKGSAEMPQITYQAASNDALEPVRNVEAICARNNLAPGAVALQFSLRNPQITSTIIGVTKPERISQSLDWATQTIDAAVWADIKQLPFSTEDPEANRDYRPG